MTEILIKQYGPNPIPKFDNPNVVAIAWNGNHDVGWFLCNDGVFWFLHESQLRSQWPYDKPYMSHPLPYVRGLAEENLRGEISGESVNAMMELVNIIFDRACYGDLYWEDVADAILFPRTSIHTKETR
jgi:hypothetical protein